MVGLGRVRAPWHRACRGQVLTADYAEQSERLGCWRPGWRGEDHQAEVPVGHDEGLEVDRAHGGMDHPFAGAATDCHLVLGPQRGEPRTARLELGHQASEAGIVGMAGGGGPEISHDLVLVVGGLGGGACRKVQRAALRSSGGMREKSVMRRVAMRFQARIQLPASIT
jgi:hypothetical protein